MYLSQASSGDFTTVEIIAIERALNNSCSQSLARAKGIHKNVKVCFPNISVRVEFSGTKPQFAEIFRYYITEAQIIQNRGFRSTLKKLPPQPANFYTPRKTVIFDKEDPFLKTYF